MHYSLKKEDKTAAIIKCLKRIHEDIIIQRSVLYDGNEFIIISINDESFYRSKIKSIKFAPDSELQIIGTRAFERSLIESISLPSSLKKISSYAFLQCQNLQIIGIPLNSELQIIENCAFAKSAIKQIYFPPHVTQISGNTFISCTKLKHIEIPPNSQLQVIGKYAFVNSSIEKIFIPKNVTKIEEYAFSKCKNLTNIEFSNDSHLQTIEMGAFSKSSIENINIPSCVKQISKSSFRKCKKLINISIPPIMFQFLDWNNKLPKELKITIIPDNEYIRNLNDDVIIGKSDMQNVIYDNLIFVTRNRSTFAIPSLINKIKYF